MERMFHSLDEEGGVPETGGADRGGKGREKEMEVEKLDG